MDGKKKNLQKDLNFSLAIKLLDSSLLVPIETGPWDNGVQFSFLTSHDSVYMVAMEETEYGGDLENVMRSVILPTELAFREAH